MAQVSTVTELSVILLKKKKVKEKHVFLSVGFSSFIEEMYSK